MMQCWAREAILLGRLPASKTKVLNPGPAPVYQVNQHNYLSNAVDKAQGWYQGAQARRDLW